MKCSKNSVRILALGSSGSDMQALTNIFEHSAWSFRSVRSVADARNSLAEEPAHVVLCETELSDGSWKDLLHYTEQLAAAPQMIVLARNPDQKLWAEVFSLGAWDVLNRPYNPKEVYETTHQAWRHFVSRSKGPVSADADDNHLTARAAMAGALGSSR